MRNVVYFLIAGFLMFSCQTNSDKANQLEDNSFINEAGKPLVSTFDLYEVDSIFLPLMPDTSVRFSSLKEASKYNLSKGRELHRFILENFKHKTVEEQLKISQANNLFNENQMYISFRQIKSEPKTVNTMNTLGFFSPRSRDNQLDERKEFYNSFPAEIKSSEAGQRTLWHLNEYSFKNNQRKNINDMASIAISDSSGKSFLFPKMIGKKDFTILIFGASWCGACRIDEAHLNQWIENIDTSRIQVVGLSVDSDRERYLRMLLEDSLKWTCYLIEGAMENPLVKELQFNSIPRHFLVDSSGKVLLEHVDIRKILSYLTRRHRRPFH